MAYQQQQTVYVQRSQGQFQMQPQYVHVQTGQPTYTGQVVAETAPANQSRGRQKFAKDSQKRCGILQIVLGVLAMVIGGIMIPLGAGYGISFVGTGIWCGVFMIIAGSFGVWSAHSETTGPIVTCMVMSILASVFGFIFFIMSAVALGMDNNPYRRFRYDASLGGGWIAVDVLGILIGLAEIVVSVTQSAICCRTTCCGGPQPPPTIVYVPQPFPAQYALQTQGVVQATNIPAGSSQVTVIQPGHAIYPAVGHPGAQQGYAPQQGNVPQHGYAQQGSQPGAMQAGQQAAGAMAPPQYSQQGPVPPAYTEKPPASNPDV